MNDAGKAACRLAQRPSRGVLRGVRQHLRARLRRHDRRAPPARSSTTVNTIYPNVADGVDGMNFITQCVASAHADGQWLPLRASPRGDEWARIGPFAALPLDNRQLVPAAAIGERDVVQQDHHDCSVPAT